MKYLFAFIIIFLFNYSSYSQSKKKVKENGISSKIEWQFDYKDGNEKKYKESEFKFDDAGNMIMEKYYDENGNTIKHIEYQYDNSDRLILEITYNSKKQVVKKEEFKYKGDLKIEKRVFGSDGKLKSKKIYEYNTTE